MGTDYEHYKLYNYTPSFTAAVIAAALFGLSTAAHVIQLFKSRVWYFIPFIIGGIFEAVGYVGRMISSKETPGEWTTPPYVMQSLLLLLAPALFAASVYMILGRIIRLTHGESRSLIRPTWLTKIFVSGDVISFLAQSAGGGMLANAKTSSKQKLGEHVITAGLIIQIVFFGFFVIVALNFHYRLSQHPTRRSRRLKVSWRGYLFILYFASMLIMVRSVFRVMEYVQGSDGRLMKHEYYIYLFDAVLMFQTMLAFNIWHPSRIIPSKADSDELDIESSTESSYPLDRVGH